MRYNKNDRGLHTYVYRGTVEKEYIHVSTLQKVGSYRQKNLCGIFVI